MQKSQLHIYPKHFEARLATTVPPKHPLSDAWKFKKGTNPASVSRI